MRDTFFFARVSPPDHHHHHALQCSVLLPHTSWGDRRGNTSADCALSPPCHTACKPLMKATPLQTACVVAPICLLRQQATRQSKNRKTPPPPPPPSPATPEPSSRPNQMPFPGASYQAGSSALLQLCTPIPSFFFFLSLPLHP